MRLEVRGSRWYLDPVQGWGAVRAEGQREQGGAEQRLYSPMGWRFGRLAVLSLECGMEKHSII
jgi:hypothetical protein